MAWGRKADLKERSGFTLIELLLTFALIALLSSIFVWNINTLLQRGEMEALENEFWEAVETAKQQAVFERQACRIHFDDETTSFVVTMGAEERRFEIDTSGLGEGIELGVAFKEALPRDGYRLARGELVTHREVEWVSFFPDGTCSPFSVDLRIDEHQSSFQIDPWTGARLAMPGES